jgi:hypothetical protein
MNRTIAKVEVSGLFWKDLSKLRNTSDYWSIRKNIGQFVLRLGQGEPGGEKGFRNSVWGDAKHVHVGSNAILFNTFPESDTLKLCALRNHAFYNFKGGRKNQDGPAAAKVATAAGGPSLSSPGWPQLRWSDPAEIAGHPEFAELSREGIEAVYRDVLDEGQDLTRLTRQIDGMSDRNAARVADGWLNSLIDAEAACEKQLLAIARRRPDFMKVAQFESWLEGPR